MKPRALFFLLPLAGAVFFLAPASDHAQQNPLGHATDFTTDSYYEPPHDQQVKMRLSGAEASPLPGGLLDVKQLTVEMFSLDGTPQMVVRAPQCIYAPLDGVASSAGKLEFQTGDGRFRGGGEGFLWRQNDQLLIISNHVHTVMKAGILKWNAP